MTKPVTLGKTLMLGKCRCYPVTLSLFLLCWFTACTGPILPTWLGGERPAPTPPPIVVTTNLEVWHWSGTAAEDRHLQELLDGFQQSHPTVAVNLVQAADYARRLRTALGNDRPPDVLYLNSYQLPDLIAAGTLAPLPAAMMADTDSYAHLRSAMQVEGTPYCRPHSFHMLALFYNKTLFDAAALPYPDGTWDWAALRSAAEKLTDVESGQYGMVVAADLSRWLAFLRQAGGAIVNAEGTTMAINSPEATAALDFYTNLILEGMAATPATLDSRWPGEAFGRGKVALAIEGNWLLPYLTENVPALSYGVAPLPVGPAGSATVSFATCYAITAASPHQEAARALLDYLTAPEQLASWIAIESALPARRTLQEAWRAAHPDQEALLDQIVVATEWQLPTGFQPWVAEVNDGLRRVFGGFIPASAVLPEAESAGNLLLAP